MCRLSCKQPHWGSKQQVYQWSHMWVKVYPDDFRSKWSSCLSPESPQLTELAHHRSVIPLVSPLNSWPKESVSTVSWLFNTTPFGGGLLHGNSYGELETWEIFRRKCPVRIWLCPGAPSVGQGWKGWTGHHRHKDYNWKHRCRLSPRKCHK